MLQTVDCENQILLRFEGHLDTAMCAEMESGLRDAVTASILPIVFDLSKADFISSSFLRLCIYANRQAGERGFSIVGAGPSIKRVFKIAGLNTMLKTE
jgi:anti-anti-sigma factor